MVPYKSYKDFKHIKIGNFHSRIKANGVEPDQFAHLKFALFAQVCLKWEFFIMVKANRGNVTVIGIP